MLPQPGGVFQQDEEHLRRLLRIFEHLEEWRKLEMDKSTREAERNSQR